MRKLAQRSALEAFIPQLRDDPDALPDAVMLPLAEVFPNEQQARQAFDEDALQGLAASIAADGVLEPILVRRITEGRYQIIAGERRRQAAALAGLDRIPALVRDVDDHKAAIWTAVENLQREDLDIEDEARWLQLLLDESKMSLRELAKRLGKDHKYIWRRVRLLRHPDLMRQYRAGELTQNAIDDLLTKQDTASSGPDVEPDPAPYVPPTRTERADLSHDGTNAPSWRLRPLQALPAKLKQWDPAQVPPRDVRNVQIVLNELERAIADFRARLPPPEDFDPTPRPPDPRYRQ